MLNRKNITAWIDDNRIYILLAGIFIFMSLFAPRFFGLRNVTNILRSASMNSIVAIGFTIVLITKEFDLSIGSVLTLGAVFSVGFRLSFGAMGVDPSVAWMLSFLIAVAAGILVGFINGFLVAKLKINSFIVTLGTMIIIQGIVYIYTDSSLSATSPADFALSDFLRNPIFPSLQLFTPRILIAIILVVLFELIIGKTGKGRNFYLVGGNRETAWLAGVKPDFYVIIGFMISGCLSAIGGSLAAMEMSSAPLDLGSYSLMIIIAATIIGGTSITGGKGSVLKSAVAILMLETLFNGLVRFRVGSEVKIFISGIILAFVVLYEAYSVYSYEKTKGQRVELLKEKENYERKKI